MEVLECDRCKKRIGEKEKPEAKEARIIRVPVKDAPRSEQKLLCAECARKLDEFMSGKDDLREAPHG